ncbi:hypothetical protein CDCA_CDCA09G2632 [Cyanidium caldarium]|uniref:Thioredoxin domain-containing protein n=1 Tax=Cyanidium caldarium TaxID=2771 RepID=A0AAV9IWB8_CYACA|nr:hypothetical protein CDCA_CDCA09G2632 [Cyanidium caldarium]
MKGTVGAIPLAVRLDPGTSSARLLGRIGTHLCRLVVYSRVFLFLISLRLVSAMYEDAPHVERLTAANFGASVLNSGETWLVEFYAPWCGHCRNLEAAWRAAAEKLDGLVRVGAVNCDEETALAQRFGIRGYPTIKLFSGRARSPARATPLDYHGGRTVRDLVSFARSSVQGVFAKVDASGISAFFSDEAHKPHVLLITDKVGVSARYRALSERYATQVSFGVLSKRSGDDAGVQALLLRYAARSGLPVLIAFPKGSRGDPSDVQVLHDKAKMDAPGLHAFVRRLLHGTADAARAPTPAAAVDTPIVSRLANMSEFHGPQCLQHPTARFCLVLVLADDDGNVSQHLAHKYRHDGVQVVVLPLDVIGATTGKRVAAAAAGRVLLARPRKQKIAQQVVSLANANAAASECRQALLEQASALVDRALGGDIHYEPLSAFLNGDASTRDEL